MEVENRHIRPLYSEISDCRHLAGDVKQHHLT